MKKRTESLQIRLTDRTKRRLSTLANDKSMSMNDIVNLAIKNYLDDYDMTYSEPDMVLDRMNSVLRSQMNMLNLLMIEFSLINKNNYAIIIVQINQRTCYGGFFY